MNKEEMIRTLVLISQLEGYLLGKIGSYVSEPMANELGEVCEMLAKHIKEST